MQDEGEITTTKDREKEQEQSFSSSLSTSIKDPSLCKGYIIGLCVCDTLFKTKEDRGRCRKVHRDDWKSKYRMKVEGVYQEIEGERKKAREMEKETEKEKDKEEEEIEGESKEIQREKEKEKEKEK